MYGMGTGDLSVLLVSNDRSTSTRIWLENGDQGNQWKSAKVTISSDITFRVSEFNLTKSISNFFQFFRNFEAFLDSQRIYFFALPTYFYFNKSYIEFRLKCYLFIPYSGNRKQPKTY